MAARLTTILTLTVLATAAVSCDAVTCTDQGCEPTYTLHLESPTPELEVGTWRVDLEIDGAPLSAECIATGPNDGPENISCDIEPWTPPSGRSLDVNVSISERTGPGSGEATDSGEPPEMSNQGISVTVFSNNEDAPVTTLDVTISFEDAIVFESQQSPTYEVEEDFGGPGCGSCLRGVSEVVTLP